MSEKDIYEPEVSGGYLLEIDGYAKNSGYYSETDNDIFHKISKKR